MALSLIFLLLLPILSFAADLHIRIPTSNLLSNPSILPASTSASLTTLGTYQKTLLNRNNEFEFRNVGSGSYLMEIHCRDFTFAPLRVDVGESEKVQVWQTFRGNEWDNRGERLDERPIEAKVLGQKAYYEIRSGFSPLSLLKNPMILLAVVAMGIMFGMPYLLDNMDPEMRAEFEEQQKNNPLAGGAAGANPLQNFDMAAWMAGATEKKDTGDRDRGGNVRRRG
ncbi:MAG: hypothetical protein M1834_001848 [Cirrosporium novae-zelandiae]|nr:MAG: hypothetical protein M1834_001848 [Cirrosporium novae-zelandiae]